MMRNVAPRRLVLALALLVSATLPVHAQSPSTAGPALLDFESLSASQGCGGNQFGSYGGLTWTGWGVAPSAECGGEPSLGDPYNGYHYGRVSGRKVGYLVWPVQADPFATLMGTIAVPTGHFSMLDGWLTAAWTRQLHVTVAAYRGPTLVGTRALRLDYDAPQFVTFNFIDVTAVTFTAAGGQVDWQLAGISNNLVVDDLRVSLNEGTNVVPEPATLALVLPGVLAVAIARRRRATRRP